MLFEVEHFANYNVLEIKESYAENKIFCAAIILTKKFSHLVLYSNNR